MSTLDFNQFLAKHIQDAYQRTEVLNQTVKTELHSSPLLMNCLEELHVSLEELEVAQEELCRQHDELCAAQQELDAERRRYQDLFEFAPDVYLITDAYGTIREANLAAAELFKIRIDRLIGKPLGIFVTAAQRCSFSTMLNQLPKIQRIQEWEIDLCDRESYCFHAAITVEVTRSPNEKSLRWLIRNITSRKQAEEQLQQTQLQNLELVEIDRLRRQFIATLTHELRTPMNAILGFSDLLLRQFRAQDWGRETNMLERVQRNGQHLLLLIEDMLDFSKLEANRLALNVREADLCELVQEIVEELRPLAEQKHLVLNMTASPPSLKVFNDPLRLRQIVINLLSNAIKFTDIGWIEVEVLALPQSRVAIIVRDSGVGISSLDRQQIFQAFWQVNQTTTRSHGGTGLGLSITKALVEYMQGSLSVESAVGQGSLFRVELPQQIASATPEG